MTVVSGFWTHVMLVQAATLKDDYGFAKCVALTIERDEGSLETFVIPLENALFLHEELHRVLERLEDIAEEDHKQHNGEEDESSED